MKKSVLFAISILSMTALAEGIVLAQTPIDPRPLAAVFVALALTLSVCIALSVPGFVRHLRHRATRSAWIALTTPLLLLLPYFIYASGTGTFSLRATAKLTAYIILPTVLLLPDRARAREAIGWRDVVAMLALGVPVAGDWLEGVWTWPQELYLFRPLYSVAAGGYAFMAVRGLDSVGYRLGFRKDDIIDGLANFVAFALLGIPLGLMLGFLHPHADPVATGRVALEFFGIYITVAVPEELLFRGILQNLLSRTLTGKRGRVYALAIASIIFGASHLHHPPVPNWKYGIMATLAGVFYGNAFRTRGRLSAPALTHTLVDTLWHFWL